MISLGVPRRTRTRAATVTDERTCGHSACRRRTSGLLRLAAALVLLVPLLSCGGGGNGNGDGDDDGGGTPSVWLEQQELGRADGVIREKVAYRSGTLKIYAEICRPDDATQHPVVLWNHGGFAGLFDGDRRACQEIAKAGFVFAASYYRGEGGSEGQLEACRGEVDDVSALMDAVRQQTYANSARVGAIGASHGGCVTLQLAIRRPELRAAADFFGPADWAELYNWWTTQMATGEPRCAEIGRTDCQTIHADLARQLREALGGTPQQVPQAYADRSPVHRLAQLTVPTLILHGMDDIVIPYEQACEKREALTNAGKAPAAWFLDTSLHEQTDRTACDGGFRKASVALSAVERYAFVLYEGQGHEFDSDAARDHAITLAVAFALTHL